MTDLRDDEGFLSGGGEMGALMRAHDWSGFPLGPPAGWPEGLKIPLRMMLSSRFEMWLGWGPDINFFYNDAYRPTLGVKHPAALGRPVREVWAEIYDAVKGRFESVMRDGVTTGTKRCCCCWSAAAIPKKPITPFPTARSMAPPARSKA